MAKTFQIFELMYIYLYYRDTSDIYVSIVFVWLLSTMMLYKNTYYRHIQNHTYLQKNSHCNFRSMAEPFLIFFVINWKSGPIFTINIRVGSTLFRSRHVICTCSKYSYVISPKIRKKKSQNKSRAELLLP